MQYDAEEFKQKIKSMTFDNDKLKEEIKKCKSD